MSSNLSTSRNGFGRMSRTVRESLLARVWAFYCQQLSERPFFTRALTSTAGMGTGDAIAQLGNEETFSRERTLKYSAFGFLIHGPGCHCFYKILDTVVPPTHPVVMQKVLLKICIDQTVWSPILLCLFYSFMHTWEGTLANIKSTMDEKFWTTFRTGLKVWIPAHVINYGFMPPSQRILYVNIVSVLWVVILSTLTDSQKTDDKPLK